MQKHFGCWLIAVFFGLAASLSAAPIATNVFAGGLQSFIALSDGSLWAAGDNAHGQLGVGTFNYPIYRFREVFTNSGGVVATDGEHSLMFDKDGALLASGDNSAGDLGIGGSSPINHFNTVNVVPTGATSIGVGVTHSMFVTKAGALMGMGANNSAQLGDGTQNNTNKPELIVRNGVVSVACASAATLYVRTDGAVVGTGQFNGDRLDHDSNRPQPLYFGGATNVVCGAQYCLIITTNGALLAFGANAKGQLGDGTTNSPAGFEQIVSNGVVAAACGSVHSHFIKSDGSLWAMGFNQHGELGDGTTNNSLAPELIVSNSVIAVAAGQGHCLFLKSDGSVWACGYDGLGNFGDGFTNTAVLTPVQVFPASAPALAATVPGGSELQFSAACRVGGTYYLLATTNLALPINRWATVATNSVLDRFNNVFAATLTNALSVGAGQTFYMLQSP